MARGARRRGGSTGGGGGASHAIFTNAPSTADGWTTVFDFGDWTQVPPTSGNFNGFTTIERVGEGTLASNLSVGTDATQPGGSTTPGFIRTTFPTSLAGGFAPAVWRYSGTWPGSTTQIFIGYTFRLSSTWQDVNTGTKHFFWGDSDNNHWCGHDRAKYPNSGGGTSADLGWMMGPQAPTSFVALSNITPFARNTWFTIEFRVNYGTAGTANGTAQAWRNGTGALFAPYTYNDIYTGSVCTESTLNTIQWASSGQSINMDRFQWEPTYGGGATSPPTSMSIDIGHVFCRVR